MSKDEKQGDSLISLFEGNVNYFTIPRYQRRYVWEEKNWEQLYEDIQFALKTENWDHFIGTFVFQMKKHDATNVENIIIDGQQRIVTFQVMFMAIVARYNSLKVQTDDAKILAKITGYKRLVTDIISRKTIMDRDEKRVLVEYDPCYQVIYNTVLLEDDVEEMLRKNHRSKIMKCFEYFWKIFSNYDLDALFEFYTKVIQIQYVNFSSYSEEYAYNIFETLNARGAQLKQIELLKNYFFHYLLPIEKNGIEFDKYKQKWGEMEDFLAEKKLDYDEFLYHLFKCCYNEGKKVKESNLYDFLRQNLNKDKDAILDFFNKMLECVEIYADIVECKDENKDRAFYLNYYKIKGNKQFRPALTALYYQKRMKNITDAQLTEFLKLLRNFLLLFNLRNIPANKIEDDIYELAYVVFNAECERDITFAIYSFLIKDRTFFDLSDVPSIISGIKYSNKKRNTLRTSGELVYLFEVIYSSKYTDYTYIVNYKDWSIEHVLNDKISEQYVTQIGNLLLMEKEFNNSLGSISYAEKRVRYLNSACVWIADYAKKQQIEPTKEDIEKRTGDIGELVNSIFSFEVEHMKDVCDKTNKLKVFLNKIQLERTDYYNEFRLLTYEKVQDALLKHYHDTENLLLLTGGNC